MTTQTLNLDELETGVEKTIIYKTVKHAFAPFSVDDFIANCKQIETYAKSEEVPISEYMEHLKANVARGFPTMADEVGGLPMTALKAINNFIQDQVRDETIEGLEADGKN